MDIHAALPIGIMLTPAAGIKRQVSGLSGRKWLIRSITKEAGEDIFFSALLILRAITIRK